jgi:hypothetical protein
MLILETDPSACKVVVPRSRKLNQIEALAEWIGHVRHAPVFADLHFTVQRGPEAAHPSDHLTEIGHDKIEV